MQDIEEPAPRGVYVGLKVWPESDSRLTAFIEEHHIPASPTKSAEGRHLTLIYSRKPANILPACPWQHHIATADKLEVFNTSAGTRALVLLVRCSTIVRRHQELMKEYKLTYDYPEYRPHVTLSYNIGDFDIARLPDVGGKFLVGLGNEYVEDLKIT